MSDAGSVRLWFNPRCSKCQGADELLQAHGVEIDYVRYLDEAPTVAEIEEVLDLLGLEDPRGMMRTREPEYAGLEGAARGELIEAMRAHPVLIERPIVIRDGRAVIARPPELLLPLILGEST